MSVIGRTCKHCLTVNRSSREVAVLQGWRFFDGPSQTGKPLSDVVCPKCTGLGPEPGKQDDSWLVRCNTCDWQSDEDGDPYDEGPLDAQSAIHLADDHRCEAEVEVKAPGEDKWRSADDFNGDGNLREHLREMAGAS